MGWSVHGMAGYDRERTAVALNVPPNYSIHAVYAIGRKGEIASLPEPLQARERPSSLMPLSEIAFEGRFFADP